MTAITGSGIDGVRHALEHLVVSSLVGDRPAQRATAPTANPVLRETDRLIRAHASNPSFDVAALGRTLGLSSATLYRTYEGTGTSPASQIRAVRTARARTLLDGELAEVDTTDLRHIAELSGFGSVRALRRALSDPHGDTEPELPPDARAQSSRDEATWGSPQASRRVFTV